MHACPAVRFSAQGAQSRRSLSIGVQGALPAPERPTQHSDRGTPNRKGTDGVSTDGVIANSIFVDGPFGYSRLPTCILPKVPGRTFFPNLSKVIAVTLLGFLLGVTSRVLERTITLFVNGS